MLFFSPRKLILRPTLALAEFWIQFKKFIKKADTLNQLQTFKADLSMLQ
ncbi:hypothetical protein D1AOALGA4SA_2542 [Olavius algarvensis Delta 1 endosymbiont]|nr:hypothetical protein D1AOALGA4SA_2542 [Olavius algarvensis Delta 1 endosymbiont]